MCITRFELTKTVLCSGVVCSFRWPLCLFADSGGMLGPDRCRFGFGLLWSDDCVSGGVLGVSQYSPRARRFRASTKRDSSL